MSRIVTVHPRIVQGEVIIESPEHFCKTCHWSWDCPPTSKEVKEGVVEGRLYCCEPRIQLVLNGERFPRLTEIAREETGLCGTKGKFWIPIKEMRLDIDVPNRDERLKIRTKQENAKKGQPSKYPSHKPTEAKVVAQPRREAPVRKPYKVT